jgi:hypothetical protein
MLILTSTVLDSGTKLDNGRPLHGKLMRKHLRRCSQACQLDGIEFIGGRLDGSLEVGTEHTGVVDSPLCGLGP